MIFYFSGTGNSKWAAKTIADKTGDTLFSLPTNESASGDTVGIVFPIYAWGCPGPVEDFLRAQSFSKDQYIYIVATCGSNCGMVEKQIGKIIGRPVDAALCLPLANNYIQGGDCASIDEAKRKFAAAKPRLDAFIESVKNRQPATDMVRGPVPHITTGLVHGMFLKYATSDKSFFVDEAKCTKCRACVEVCPVKNISFENDTPNWNGNCAQCTACINRCPTEAIQYGKKSAGRRRYHFTDEIVS